MNYSISKDRTKLIITVDEEERAELREMESIGSDVAMHDFLEPITCNSELDWLYDGETGDLTGAPMLGIFGEEGMRDYTVFLENYGLRVTGRNGHNTFAVPILERWAYMGYETRAFLEVLRDEGKIILVSE